jgi:hypothetical protein
MCFRGQMTGKSDTMGRGPDTPAPGRQGRGRDPEADDLRNLMPADRLPPEDDRTNPPRASLGDLAGLFLRLGAASFGGPAAHFALMEHEVVHRLAWLSREEFLDTLGATNLIPGPNSTEMAIHIGDSEDWRDSSWPASASSCRRP